MKEKEEYIKDHLVKKFEDFKNVKFPDAPEDDEIYDLFAELVELDGHIAGLISSYLKGKTIDFKLLDADSEFERISNSLVEKSAANEIKEYKMELDEMVRMVRAIERL